VSSWTRLVVVSVLTLMVIVVVGAWVGEKSATIVGFSVPLAAGILALLINLVAFVPASARRTERFYDLTGSLTYVSVITFSLACSWPRLGSRGWLVAVLVLIWALRLGSFLYRRVMRSGRDRRFDQIKLRPSHFAVAWIVQALWVFLTSLAAVVVIATDSPDSSMSWIEVLGTMLWAFGFGVEVIADHQKTRFVQDPVNTGRFITTGLWAWSRHPNYFGEIVLWLGVFVIGVVGFEGWQWLAGLSPVFVWVVLTQISGIPMLEPIADQRWGVEPAYQRYKEHTPVLWPRRPRDSQARS